ncbi:metal-dependent transcriptional regulator [Kineosporia sp. NBRC 101731]|uniref:metal-dependent transcriptional regulator n=1 Tax=Kineosporia sp. NBRC 101731 TaxID=3032199 RepID=UPI0024A2E0B5|nr:metal-dependent transcriptional regulator [Kineosporia sp. NBRC 101731]GLY29010.1 DtxR family transcriptional regulator [Kineosporia sp. NBRC 101731]
MDDHDLIDTSEMYLKAVLELEEEGVVPLRARLVERFAQSGPTVSQTVDRLRRDQLLELGSDRQIVLTDAGRASAGSIMRKHRLTEVFLHQVVGLEWPLLHVEACRWEHVVSDHTEGLIDRLLGHPRHSPYGNPITRENSPAPDIKVENLTRRATRPDDSTPAWIAWIGEPLQADPAALGELLEQGLIPGTAVTVVGQRPSGVTLVNGGTHDVGLSDHLAKHVFVSTTAPDLDGTPPARVPGGQEALAALAR